MQPIKPKSVLVIGGGPSGLVTLRNLIEQGEFNRVGLVERRDDIGGVWYLSKDELHGDSHNSHTKPHWRSPAYPGLIGNVLPQFLSFSDFPFPQTTKDHPHQPFPTLTETYEYLRSFVEPFIQRGNVRLNWEVVKVGEREQGGWEVRLRDWNGEAGGKECIEYWDAVVVAVGWYDNPVWPNTDGLDEIKSKGLATHAKFWHGVEGYEGKRVLLVGNAASSNDIAAYLAPVVRAPVYQSIRRPPFPGFVSLPDDRIRMVAPVAKYASRATKDGKPAAEATLTDGTVISDIDIVILGTGYKPYPSFVHILDHDNSTGEPHLSPLVHPSIKPYRVPSIHRHILYAYNPTLAFIGLPMAFTPFTIADISSTWLSLAWSGHLTYPATVDGRLEFEKQKLESLQKMLSETDSPSSFLAYSVVAWDEQDYASQLREDIVNTKPELDKILTVWSDEKTREREAMYRLKLEVLQYERERESQVQN